MGSKTLPKTAVLSGKRPTIIGAIGPALVALSAVLLEPYLTNLTSGREAVLPCIMVGLLFALVHPRFRHLLVVTLCYGVALLALRDIFFRPNNVVLPAQIASRLAFNTEILDLIRSAGLFLVAVLAASAAIGESFRPGTVWARRCYFGAASIYFSGLGLLTYVWQSNWQSLMLCVTGVTALFGCIFAPGIVASEELPRADDEVSDETHQEQVNAAHRRALREKEWRDVKEIIQ